MAIEIVIPKNIKLPDEPYHVGPCRECAHRRGFIWLHCNLDKKMVNPDDMCPAYIERDGEVVL